MDISLEGSCPWLTQLPKQHASRAPASLRSNRRQCQLPRGLGTARKTRSNGMEKTRRCSSSSGAAKAAAAVVVVVVLAVAVAAA